MESDRRKKFWNDDSCDDAVAVEDLWCARYDSRPELKAKDPKGSAESERRRSAWRAGDAVSGRRWSVEMWTNRHRWRGLEVHFRTSCCSIGLLHLEDAVQGRLSHAPELSGFRWRNSWRHGGD